MTTDLLVSISHQLAAAVGGAAPSVVQVQGRRRPASGLVYAGGVVLTTARALGREEGLRVRRDDGAVLDAELAGWDPATTLAVLDVPRLDAPPIRLAETRPAVGHLGIAIARSWSNSVTATQGIVSVVGGPLRTGRRHAIEQVIRTNATMHEGFAGGAFVDATGGLLGVATSTAIRGLGVVIPASIAWAAAAAILEHGSVRQGYLGIAAQSVRLPDHQQGGQDAHEGILVIAVTSGSPAAEAGVLVGDVITMFDGRAISSPDDLMELLAGDRVGRDVHVRGVRGQSPLEITVRVGERPHP